MAIYIGGTGGANKFDDYEEGTWTPQLQAHTGGSLVGGSGRYTKIGNNVYAAWWFANVDGTALNASANIVLQGLPFTSSSTVQNQQPAQLFTHSISFVGDQRQTFYFPTSSTYLGGYRSVSGTSWGPWGSDDFRSTGVYFMSSITYEVT